MTPDHADSAALSAARFSVVDVETSGLSARRHRVLQVAVVTVNGEGTVLDVVKRLVAT